jgi:hypothetical protein
MFSRSFSAARKNSEDDIKARALVNRSTVRRPHASSGEHNYAYTDDGFRVFQNSKDNYALNLVADYQHFMKDASKSTTLPYHHAITALHHAQTVRTTKTLLSQARILQRLAVAASTVATTTVATASTIDTTAPPNYEDSRHLLDKMKYAIPFHPKTKVVYCNRRIPGFHFDPANVPPERTFVKLCCKQLSSADTCCCHADTSHESLQYANAQGEQLLVCYFKRKNDYFNTTYRMWGDSSDAEDENRVPHSPREEVSDSEIWPYHVDSVFEDKVQKATEAVTSGFQYLWSNKRDQHRFERRRRRSKQLASGELPEYGLILIIPDTDETRALSTHPITRYDDERRESYKAKYENIRNKVHADAIAQGLVKAPQPPQPESDSLPSFLLERKFQDIKKRNSTSIERPLSFEMRTVAHSVAMLQVTPISALQPHHRIRTVAGSLASLLALHLCCEKTFMLAHIDQKANSNRKVHNLHFIHHDAVHRILRRASGSQCRADKIAARYTECASDFWLSVPSKKQEQMRKYTETKFAPNIPIPENSTLYGPRSFHLAKFFASECLKLIGTTAATATAATEAKWAKLRTDVMRVRRGELTANQVMLDSGCEDDYWVYSVYYTFNQAAKYFLEANAQWINRYDIPPPSSLKTRKGQSSHWPGSQEIGVRMSRVIQTTLMIRELYRFIIKASPVLSTEFSGVFGYNIHFMKTMVSRAKHIATKDGDEASALIFGHFLPCMMTPDVHLDIYVQGSVFQHPELYVKMSDRVFGQLKKEQRDVIPSRHTGTIERAIIHR